MADQAGRIAVVTGGGRGLGRGAALGLAGAGATVVAVARSEAQLAETAALARDAGRTVIPMTADVSQVDAVMALGERVRAEVGAPTILVNAAGTFGPIALIQDGDPHDWVRTVLIDAIAPYLTTRAFLAGMLEAGWGRIVNITSAASLHPPGALNSAYGTSKVALNQLTRHLAAEIEGTGVTANVLHPGDVKTEMWADIRAQCAALGEGGGAYQQWVEWVEQTGGDPPEKAAERVVEIATDATGRPNGRFLWVREPLQPPIPSWGDEDTAAAAEAQPWR